MDKSLYELHMAYGKHTGHHTMCTSTSVNGKHAHLCYCPGCRGFYADTKDGQEAVAPHEHCVPEMLGELCKAWRQFVLDIGGQIMP